MRERGRARFFLVTDLRSVGSDFVPYHRTFGVQLRNIAHELESFRKGGRPVSSHTRSHAQDDDLGVSEKGTITKIYQQANNPLLLAGKRMIVRNGIEQACQ